MECQHCHGVSDRSNRAAIQDLDRAIFSGFRHLVEPKFYGSAPEEEADEQGHRHLVTRHGFSAGGHVYTLTLRQES